MDIDISDTVALLEKLYNYYQLLGDKGRKIAYSKAVDILKSLESQGKTSTTVEELLTYKGIAESISSTIREYSETGVSSKLQELESKHGKLDSAMEFTKYYGIGPIKALEIHNKGIDKVDLTPSQLMGIKWYPHYSRPIQRAEINIIRSEILSRLSRLSQHYLGGEQLKVEFAGSYRRGLLESGDIDILIQKKSGITMDSILDYLDNIIPVRLKEGETIFNGIVKLSDSLYGHRIDILLVDKDEWYTSLLHFTGSKRFNLLMSRRANEVGGSLSRKMLTLHGTQIPVDSEEEIFEILGVEYIAPEGRSL